MDPDPQRRQGSCLDFLLSLANGKTRRSVSQLSLPQHAALPREGKGHVFQVERRASVRLACPLGAVCSTDPSAAPPSTTAEDAWEATLHDISRTGIGLQLARRFEPGATLGISVHPHDSRPLLLTAKVVRVQPLELGHWFFGCSFLESLSDPQLQGLFLLG
jgi:hypothetical protein